MAIKCSTCTAEMPTSANRKTNCEVNGSPAIHQTFQLEIQININLLLNI